MSVESLRAAIQERAQDLLPPLLVAAGIQVHKKDWRNCPCSWCEKKREATVVIGSHVPRTWRGQYVEDIRDVWREEKRQQYRKAMRELEQ